jgi:membrane-bound hydrogenase subunit mbhJ
LNVWRLALPRVLAARALHTERLPRARRRSIFIRHIDGGSSNVFEAELTALTNPMYDLGQYGIRFVAAPSHADVLLLTGPLTRSMLEPARAAFAVMPEPKAIVTVGDFADFRAGDPHGALGDPNVHRMVQLFAESYATTTLPDQMRRAIVAHVPGDPPEPREIIRTLLSIRLPG